MENDSINIYNSDNKIYKLGCEFVFNYYIIKDLDTLKAKAIFVEGDLKDMSFSEIQKSWEYIGIKETTKSKISSLTISPIKDKGPLKELKDYRQTVAHYKYYAGSNELFLSSHSGIVENSKNVWIHPPRDQVFQILELNPFPFIKFPAKAGNSWTWQLDVGSQYGDKRWAEWDGVISLRYKYKIIGKVKIETKLGFLDCHRVDAEADCILGKTYLTSYFNKKYGFVKLEYLNIDGSKMVLSLEKMNTTKTK